jgi:hypothetical protein
MKQQNRTLPPASGTIAMECKLWSVEWTVPSSRGKQACKTFSFERIKEKDNRPKHSSKSEPLTLADVRECFVDHRDIQHMKMMIGR